MCRLNQYTYTCAHPATHAFRASLCARQPLCTATDTVTPLPFPCRVCRCLAAQSRSRSRSRRRPSKARSYANNVHDLELQSPVVPREARWAVWYVPARCFVDVGFRELDPFRVRKEGEKVELAVCCAIQKECGPFRTTRLEDVDTRIQGRVMTTNCWSEWEAR